MIHEQDHPLARKKVKLTDKTQDPLRGKVLAGEEFRVENWVDRMDDRGLSWMHMDGNWAAMHYAMRSGATGLPIDDEVVYGKIENSEGWSEGHMVHASELGEVVDG